MGQGILIRGLAVKRVQRHGCKMEFVKRLRVAGFRCYRF